MSSKYALPVINSKSRGAETACIIHGEPIITGCSLSECALHTTYPGVKNCILVYMSKHKVDTLGTLDLSMLLSIPHTTIKDDTARALSLLRQESVETTSCHDIDPNFVVLSGVHACSVCESPISGEAYHEELDFKYCSSSCLSAKPLQVLALEASCGVDIRDVLVWAANRYITAETFQEALDLPAKMLEELVRKYFNLSIADLYSQLSPSAPPSLGKRVGRAPAWLSAFSDVTAVVQEKMIDKYGSITVELSALHKEFDNLI